MEQMSAEWDRMSEQAPILEFDPEPRAFIEPSDAAWVRRAPRAAVGCFHPWLVHELSADGDVLAKLPSLVPFVEIDDHGQPLGVFYPGQAAPLCAVTVERVLAAGVDTIVACGGAGALVPELGLGDVVVVESALRDEGTSYHYLPPSRTVAADAFVVETLTEVADAAGVDHTGGMTWTTDGLFRQTPDRIAQRRGEGCIVVEQEAAALLAIAEFRGVRIGQYLYAGDDVSGAVHDDRGWRNAHDTQRRLFDLAAQAALTLIAD